MLTSSSHNNNNNSYTTNNRAAEKDSNQMHQRSEKKNMRESIGNHSVFDPHLSILNLLQKTNNQEEEKIKEPKKGFKEGHFQNMTDSIPEENVKSLNLAESWQSIASDMYFSFQKTYDIDMQKTFLELHNKSFNVSRPANNVPTSPIPGILSSSSSSDDEQSSEDDDHFKSNKDIEARKKRAYSSKNDECSSTVSSLSSSSFIMPTINIDTGGNASAKKKIVISICGKSRQKFYDSVPTSYKKIVQVVDNPNNVSDPIVAFTFTDFKKDMVLLQELCSNFDTIFLIPLVETKEKAKTTINHLENLVKSKKVKILHVPVTMSNSHEVFKLLKFLNKVKYELMSKIKGKKQFFDLKQDASDDKKMDVSLDKKKLKIKGSLKKKVSKKEKKYKKSKYVKKKWIFLVLSLALGIGFGFYIFDTSYTFNMFKVSSYPCVLSTFGIKNPPFINHANLQSVEMEEVQSLQNVEKVNSTPYSVIVFQYTETVVEYCIVAIRHLFNSGKHFFTITIPQIFNNIGSPSDPIDFSNAVTKYALLDMTI
ncbi:mitophagy protein ATG32 SCDLUD_005300 [Saccharomycodes ludwigii]|uniref:mitophagy protein ATG32 n=1 Tax=Saccharomycodes ludwigii TaxID=36035 RepID=UPI001E847197|nr:hypothetical protein SCDLUD_005300 [Saccharomycodes ludwigii]KAH3898953.1 hypothetical protein SCDLUD_005300 [Saccharomycodes ludwigii]